jgi:hypothetical protein
MFQNICDIAPAIPFSSAEESQCLQYSDGVTQCPDFISNHCRQALERHLHYLISQCELVCTRAMAHHTIGGERTLGGACTVNSACFAVHLKRSIIDRIRSFGLRPPSKLWQLSAPGPHWHMGREIRNCILCFKRLDRIPLTQRRLRRFLLNNQPGGLRCKSHVLWNLGPKQGEEQ